MSASVADRSRAARIRRKGNLAIAEEREWLSAYEAEKAPDIIRRPPGRPPRIAPPAAPPATPVAGGVSPGPAAPERHLRIVPPPPSIDTPDGHVAIDFGAPVGGAIERMAPMHSVSCSIPDCPRCRAAAGALVCQSTGEKVWPRMSEDGARGLAGALMGAVVLVARMLGKDVVASQDEIERLAKALRETIYQRAGAMGAGDDLYAIGWIFLLFGVRVYQAPRLAK